nr:hypothetical protein [Rhizobium terrae]
MAGSTDSGIAAGGFEFVFADDAALAGAFAVSVFTAGAFDEDAAFGAVPGGFIAAEVFLPLAAPEEGTGPSVAYSSFALSQCSLSLPAG